MTRWEIGRKPARDQAVARLAVARTTSQAVAGSATAPRRARGDVAGPHSRRYPRASRAPRGAGPIARRTSLAPASASALTARAAAATPAIGPSASAAEAKAATAGPDFSLPNMRVLTQGTSYPCHSSERRPDHGNGERRRHSAPDPPARAAGPAQPFLLPSAGGAARAAAEADRHLAQHGVGDRPAGADRRGARLQPPRLAGQRPDRPRLHARLARRRRRGRRPRPDDRPRLGDRRAGRRRLRLCRQRHPISPSPSFSTTGSALGRDSALLAGAPCVQTNMRDPRHSICGEPRVPGFASRRVGRRGVPQGELVHRYFGFWRSAIWLSNA